MSTNQSDKKAKVVKEVKEAKEAKEVKEVKKADDCPICCRHFTEDLRKKISCSHCQKVACTDCSKKYLLSTVEDPHCMFCKFPWNREFLDANFVPFFRTKALRLHRENVLCEREKSRLPETQALLQTVTERMDTLKEDMQVMDAEYDRLFYELMRIKEDYKDRMVNIRTIINQRSGQLNQLYRVLRGVTDTVPGDHTLIAETVERISHINMPCPDDECRGFIGDRSYTCDICKTKVCKECHEVLNEAHQCKEENLSTVKQLKKEARNCPGCSAPISKIDGCDQMWCTMCHTAFSWKSGKKIVNGQIHNPHFYEWRRNNGGLAAGAVDINGCPVGITSLMLMEQNINRLMNKAPSRILQDMHREITEINDIYLTRNEVQMTDPNRELRIDYLTGKITEHEWKGELQRREKRRLRNEENRQVYQMYVTTMMDMFRALATAETVEELTELHKEIVSLQRYVFDVLSKINNRYGSNTAPNYAKFAERLERLPVF